VVESAVEREALIESALARMTERRVAEIVGESARLGEVLVEAEGAGKRAGDLSNLKGVGQARAIVVAFVIDENLGFVSEPAERRAMDDAVAIAAEIVARRTRRLLIEAAAARSRIRREGRPGPARIHCHVLAMLPLAPRSLRPGPRVQVLASRSAVDCIPART
jgi:hypothetical protein